MKDSKECIPSSFDSRDHLTNNMNSDFEAHDSDMVINTEVDGDSNKIYENSSSLISNSFDTQRVFKSKRYRNGWGNLSYAHLIAAAILSSPRRKMKLNEIYNWFTNNIPYFSLREDEIKSRGWKNSIRHNLSLKKEFIRETGDKKAGYWYLDQKALLDRLKTENRQITDVNYNRDMELFEAYVQQAFSSNCTTIEDFITFSRKHMADTAISGIIDTGMGLEFVTLPSSSDNPFYLMSTQNFSYNDPFSKNSQSVTFSGYSSKTCVSQSSGEQPVENHLNSTNMQQSDIPCSVGQDSIHNTLSSSKSMSNGYPRNPNNHCEFLPFSCCQNVPLNGYGENIVFLPGTTAYMTPDRNSIQTMLANYLNGNGQCALGSQIIQPELMNNQAQLLSLNNFNFSLQPLDAFRNFSSCTPYPPPWNIIDPSSFQKAYSSKLPVLVNGNCLVSDLPSNALNGDSTQSILKL